MLRNVLERQGELALLRAVGFPKRDLKSLVIQEHLVIVKLALQIGLGSALITVIPGVMSQNWPWFATSLTIVGVTASAFLWVWLASSWAMSGSFLESLRRE